MKHPTRLLSLILGFGLTACGGGGSDDLEPPIIIQTASLLADITIDTFATVEGTTIADAGLGTGPFQTCGRIAEVGAYRTDSELVFRIRDEFGFCWENDVYSIWIRNVTWRNKTNSQIILTNNADPNDSTLGVAYERRATARGVTVAVDSGIEVRQWMDDPADGFFYLAIPLDLFSFYTEDSDARSVFSVRAQIDRFQPNVRAWTTTEVRDWIDAVNVDFVDWP